MRYKVTMKSRTERKLVNGNLEVTMNPKDVLSMFKGDFWRELLPEEKKRLMQILVKHVTIGEDGIEMEFHTESIKSIQEAYHAQSS